MHSSISKHKAYYFLKVKNLPRNLHLHVQPPLGQPLVESTMYCVSLFYDARYAFLTLFLTSYCRWILFCLNVTAFCRTSPPCPPSVLSAVPELYRTRL